MFNLSSKVTYFYSVEVQDVHYSEKGPKADAARAKVKEDRKRVWEWKVKTGRRRNEFKTPELAAADMAHFQAAFPDVEFRVAEGSPL